MKRSEERQREFAAAKKQTIWPSGVNKYVEDEADPALPASKPEPTPKPAEAASSVSEVDARTENGEEEDTRPWDLGCLTKTAGPDAAPRQLGSIPTRPVKIDVKEEIQKANAMVAEEKEYLDIVRGLAPSKAVPAKKAPAKAAPAKTAPAKEPAAAKQPEVDAAPAKKEAAAAKAQDAP